MFSICIVSSHSLGHCYSELVRSILGINLPQLLVEIYHVFLLIKGSIYNCIYMHIILYTSLIFYNN